MPSQGWEQAIVNAQAAGSSVSNTTTSTTLLPTHALFTLPANFFNVGTLLKFTSIGQISNVVTTPGTITLDVRFGAVVVFNGGAAQMSTTAHTTLPYWWEAISTCRAIGSGTSANLMSQGRLTGQMISATAVADSTSTHGTLLTPNTAPAVGTGFDSTATQQINHFVTFSVTTNPTNITLQQWIVESLN